MRANAAFIVPQSGSSRRLDRVSSSRLHHVHFVGALPGTTPLFPNKHSSEGLLLNTTQATSAEHVVNTMFRIEDLFI
jgi:hypothetical protein